MEILIPKSSELKSEFRLPLLAVILCFAVMTQSQTANAQLGSYPPGPPESETTVKAARAEFIPKVFTDEKGEKLKYQLLKPVRTSALADSALPLVVFLHGAGERGADNEAQLKWGAWLFATDAMQENFPAYVIAPQCPADDSWAAYMSEDMEPKLYDEPTRALGLALKLVDHMVENHNVDESRIYVTGMSMGGMGTWEMVMRRPERFAAAAPVCGAGDPSAAVMEKLAEKPIWIWHGGEDQVVKPEFSREMYEALREAGGKPGYTEYPGVNHFSWIPAYRDQQLFEWMFRQKLEK